MQSEKCDGDDDRENDTKLYEFNGEREHSSFSFSAFIGGRIIFLIAHTR